MSQTYTIKSVLGSQDGSFVAGDGTNVSLTDYQLTVANPAGQDGAVWLSQKPETPAPSVGQTIDGDTKPIPGGPLKGQLKLKKAPPPQFQGGGFTNGAQPAGDDPRQKSIERQVAAKCAAQVLTGFADLATAEAAVADLAVAKLTESFYRAIQGEPAQAPASPPVATPDVPAPDTSGFGGSGDDDSVPF